MKKIGDFMILRIFSKIALIIAALAMLACGGGSSSSSSGSAGSGGSSANIFANAQRSTVHLSNMPGNPVSLTDTIQIDAPETAHLEMSLSALLNNGLTVSFDNDARTITVSADASADLRVLDNSEIQVDLYVRGDGADMSKTLYFTVKVGYGTLDAPYSIRNEQDMDAVRYSMDKQYLFVNDVKLTGLTMDAVSGWAPIGDAGKAFSGSINGNGHKLTGLFINGNGLYSGLFGSINLASIYDLTVETASAGVTGTGRAAILSAYAEKSTISGVRVKGAVSGKLIGAVAGEASGGIINNSFADVELTLSGNSLDDAYAGGITGKSVNVDMTDVSAIFKSSYAKGGRNIYTGGISGQASGSIHNALSKGDFSYDGVNISGTIYLGGLLGSNQAALAHSGYDGSININNDQSIYIGVGGLAGQNESTGSISSSYAKGSIDVLNRGGNMHAGGGYVGRITGANTASYSDNYASTAIAGSWNSIAINGATVPETMLHSQSIYSDLGWKFGNTDDQPWKMDMATATPLLYWEIELYFPVLLKPPA